MFHVAVPESGELFDVLSGNGIAATVFPFRYRNILKLASFIRRKKIDLVYGNNFSNDAYISLLAAKLAGRSFVWHIREVFKGTKQLEKKYRRVRLADAVVCVSRASASTVQKHLPPGRDINVIYNGIEPADFSMNREEARERLERELAIPRRSPLILIVGNLGERKNQRDALMAAARVARRDSPSCFCFLGATGDSEYVDRLKQQADELNIRPLILLTGFRSDPALFYCAADILLHVPRWDPHPRVIVEGMAAKLPVVAYAVDGIVETVEAGQTGFLVPFGDIDGLSAALLKLIANPSLRKEMGERGYQRVLQRFTAEQTAQQVERVIQGVLKDRRAKAH
ncbi:MAG: N-acetyl-alpha-D-glucosaminyl L-malate synthase [Anaerolineales bacterium]|nr:N-acetyl-alpha-D-glucosaminyl L-malate synthase [Anaerolineales bacterium]